MFPVQNTSFISNVTRFVKSHPVLCLGTLGLVIIGYTFKGLSWRCISWILSCIGTAKKVEEVAVDRLKSEGQQYQKSYIVTSSIPKGVVVLSEPTHSESTSVFGTLLLSSNEDEKSLTSSSSQSTSSQLVSEKAEVTETFPKLWQIPHDPIEMIEGDSIERLECLQKQLDQLRIPLHVNPKQPAKDVDVVNKEKLEAYIARFSLAEREIVQSIFKDYFLHITFQMLQDSLRRCTEELNRALKSRSYTVGFSSGKSSQWVASLALRYLEHLPVNWTPLGSQQTDEDFYKINVPREYMKLPKSGAQPIVIFDDCGYSGTQLKEVIIQIGRKTIQEVEVYLVVPFVSEIARVNILQNYRYWLSGEQKEKVKVCLITDRTIPTIRSMDENQKATLKKISRNIFFDDEITSCLVTTDWRIPDNLPTAFGRYAMRLVQNREVTNEDLPVDQFFIKPPSRVPRPYALSIDV